MTVPISNFQTRDAIPQLGENDALNLCYEIHGEADATFNLVSDSCVSVNAHYRQLQPNEPINTTDAVYVRAVDKGGRCRNITVSVDDCSVSMDGARIYSKYSLMGVSIHSHNDRVRIAVPNCGQHDHDLVMRVICPTRNFRSSQSDSVMFVRRVLHAASEE